MKKTILVLAANPSDTNRLRLDQEVREIDNGLQRSQRHDEFILKHVWAARPRDIRRAMLDLKPNIVHFCGHGRGKEGIVLEDNTGQAQTVSAEALGSFFELFADTVECVVLTACYTEIQAEAIAQHIDHVVGMKDVVGDTAAIEFAVAFYDALGSGESVEFAYKLACNAADWTPGRLTAVLKSKPHTEGQPATVASVTGQGLEVEPTTTIETVSRGLDETEEHGLWMQVEEMMRFGDLTVPCIMSAGDGSSVYDREHIVCHLVDAPTEYPPDIKHLIEQVRTQESERRQRGEAYAWEGGPPMFGLKSWFPTRRGSSEEPVLNLILKPTTYFEFLGTNMILDQRCVVDKDGHLASLREKYAPELDWQKPVSVFSNTLGVVMSVITKDGYWVAVKRSEDVRWVPNTFQTSVGEGANLSTDRDKAGDPDIFKTVIRGVLEELGIEINENSIALLGLICDVNFYQYDMIGSVHLDADSKKLVAQRALGTKDGRFESKELFLVRYKPQAVIEFLATHQPWWPRAVASILYSLVHDFGFDAVIEAIENHKLTHLEYRCH